jgi:hypothetical protein
VIAAGTKEELAYRIGGRKMPVIENEVQNEHRPNRKRGKIGTF